MRGRQYHMRARSTHLALPMRARSMYCETRHLKISWDVMESNDMEPTISDLGTTRSASSNDPALTKILPGIESGVE